MENLIELRHLTLAGSEITDEGLKSLSRFDKLRVLSLSETGVTGAGMVHLAPLTELESLFLIDTQVDDNGLQPLGGLPALQELYLNGTPVTDQGLDHLRLCAEASQGGSPRKSDHRGGVRGVAEGVTRLDQIDAGSR